ncbi:hypothetical protein JCM3775_005160 [Rhodotorula graminis]
MLYLATVVLAAASCVSALTSDQAASFFSSSAASDLQGASTSLPQFDLSVVQNSTHSLFVVNATSTAPSSVGWLATGLGSRMADADFLIVWPTVSGSSVSWTLSHRLPDGSHGMPQLASTDAATATTAFYTVVPELTTSDASSPYSAVAYVRQRDPGSSYPTASGATAAALGAASTEFIYASSSRKPSTTAEDADLAEHNQAKGTTKLDLSQQFSVAATAAEASGSSASEGGDETTASQRRMYIAHATLGSLAFLVFTPLAILVARVGRDSFTWFPAHWVLNLITVVLVIVTFALATYEVGGQFEDFHHKLGLALLILVLAQSLLGLAAHFTRHTPLTSSRPSLRPPVTAPAVKPHGRTFGVPRLVHVVLGLVTITLGWVQVGNGLLIEWDANLPGAGTVPRGVKIAFWVLLGLWIASYVVAWVVGAVAKRAARARGSDSGESVTGQRKGLMKSAT